MKRSPLRRIIVHHLLLLLWWCNVFHMCNWAEWDIFPSAESFTVIIFHYFFCFSALICHFSPSRSCQQTLWHRMTILWNSKWEISKATVHNLPHSEICRVLSGYFVFLSSVHKLWQRPRFRDNQAVAHWAHCFLHVNTVAEVTWWRSAQAGWLLCEKWARQTCVRVINEQVFGSVLSKWSHYWWPLGSLRVASISGDLQALAACCDSAGQQGTRRLGGVSAMAGLSWVPWTNDQGSSVAASVWPVCCCNFHFL